MLTHQKRYAEIWDTKGHGDNVLRRDDRLRAIPVELHLLILLEIYTSLEIMIVLLLQVPLLEKLKFYSAKRLRFR